MPRQPSVQRSPAVRHQGFTRCPQNGSTVKISRSCGRRTGGLSHAAKGTGDCIPSWVGSIGLTIAVAVTYFLAARLSLALLEPDGVAVFWPAAGIASGVLIALGPVARLPVALGVMAATVTANLLGDRNIASSIVFALCNAGEAMIIAWLIEHHFGSGFSLDSSRRVLGLFLATAVGTAISGIGGTAGFILFHSSDAPILTTWLNWFASDAIGVVTVAPLVIGLARTLHDLPQMSELMEGSLALVVLTLVSAIGFGCADRLLVHDLAPRLALSFAALASRPLPAGVRCSGGIHSRSSYRLDNHIRHRPFGRSEHTSCRSRACRGSSVAGHISVRARSCRAVRREAAQ